MHHEHKEKTCYTFEDDSGDAQITVYHVFSGVDVAYISVHMDGFDFAQIEPHLAQEGIVLHFCKEGRMEQEAGNAFFYLMPKDFLLIQNAGDKSFRFPLGHYHGICIRIDKDALSHLFSEFMGSQRLDPADVAGSLCDGQSAVILRQVEPLVHIFSEAYAIRDDYRVDYLKIKLLELFLVLSQMTLCAPDQEECSIPRAQASLVKQVAAYIADHLNDKLGLKSLVSRFGVSDTYLQKSFRAVYGMPVASFVRMQKMQKAAQLLIHTDRSIDDIASEFGYANESKFSASFKKLMGDTPSVFRKEHSKITIR